MCRCQATGFKKPAADGPESNIALNSLARPRGWVGDSRGAGEALGLSGVNRTGGFTTGVRQARHSRAPGFSSNTAVYTVRTYKLITLLSTRTRESLAHEKRKNSRSRSVSFCTPGRGLSRKHLRS